MSDLIERQATQPEIQLSNQDATIDATSDLISRQAAIDAVNEWLKLYVINRTMSNITSIQDILRHLPSAQPELNEWCHDCKEYDKEHHCCPRWGQVIRTALEEAQPEQRWIPVSECERKCDKWEDSKI